MAEAMLGINGEIIRWAREYYNMQPDEAATAFTALHKLGIWTGVSYLCKAKKDQ